MPSQNLPKPNLPGQSTQVFSGAGTPPPQANMPQPSVPGQVQAQVVPGGLSRENPGGTPPNMKVQSPIDSLPNKDDLAKTELVAEAAKQETPMAVRPMGPLSQISLKGMEATDNKPLEKPSISPVVKPAESQAQLPITNQDKPAQAAPESKPVEQNSGAAKTKIGFSPKNIFKGKLPLPAIIGGAAILLVLIASLIFSVIKSKSRSTSSSSSSSKSTSTTSGASTTTEVTTVTYWGLWEDSQILKEVISDFESKNPSIKIDYRKQSYKDYRERLQQAIDSGNGPDIFRYHVDWVPMLSADLAALPSTVMSTADYKQTFYPSAYNNLQVGGQIVGIPLMYDGLALFYNKEMLKTANVDVPKTWSELRTAANKLTVPANTNERSNDNITRAGLAIGNAGNVDNFSDILALLIIQNGGNPANVNTQYVKDALTFYTNFVKEDKVWSDRLANSTVAFAQGDVAMILAPSWRAHDIKNLNPNLDFAVARVPQLDSNNPVAWSTFWAEGVSSKSKNKDAAWTFLKYLATPEVLRKFYNDASQYRAFGEIYPRTDMASELETSELVGAYVSDAPIAKTWYMASFTHDNGINDQIIKYYEDAVNTVLTGTDIDKALSTAATGVNSVVSKYSSGTTN